MASNVNTVTVEGNMVRDPMLKTTNTGKSVCNFCIANNRYLKKGDEFDKKTSFFEITCWGNLALSISANGKKGSLVRITGRLEQERWEYNGKTHSKIIVVAEDARIIETRYRENPYEYKGKDYSDREYSIISATNTPF